MSSGSRKRLAAGSGLTALVCGGTLAAAGAAMVLVGIAAALLDGREVLALIVPGLMVGVVGVWLVGAGNARFGPSVTVLPRHGFAAVTLAWVVAAVAGAVPLLWAGTFDSPIDAFFEAMSGFTTTGATLIDVIEREPDGILLWRSAMQWLGGVGIVVLVVAIAPVSGPGVQRAFYAEFSGVAADRLTPRIADTAKIVSGIYVFLTLAAGFAYVGAGMGPFDAVNHMMTTLATGGFSTYTQSLGAFDSIAIEVVAIVFMAVAGVNFAFYWRAIRGGSLMPQGAEVRAYLLILIGAIAAITTSLLLAGDYGNFGRALRAAAFDVTSIGTGTGYVTADFDSWNEFARVGLLALMFVGGCAGSTSGGIKVSRVVLLFQSAWQEMRRQLSPSAVQVLRMGGRSFSEEVRVAILGFFLIYILLYSIGVLAFAASGLEPASAFGAATASLNIIGPGIGDVGAVENFTVVGNGGRIVSSFLMLAGRLEVFTVVALLASLVRRRGAGG